MRGVWLRLLILAAICAMGLYALRVWRVSAGSPVATRALIASSVGAVLGLLGIGVSARQRGPQVAVILIILGSLFIVGATFAEFKLGVAVVTALAPDETVELGSGEATFRGFEASYSGGGDVTQYSSNLVVDLGRGPENVTVFSGHPGVLGDFRVFQLGFDLIGEPTQRRIHTRLGFLCQKADRPFIAGLGVFGAGALLSLLSRRRRD